MRFIDAADIARVLTFPVLVDALEAAHRRPRMEVQDAMLGPQDALYFVRHAVDPGRYMGSKLVTSFPANPLRSDLPAVQALSVLFDGGNGRPLAALDGTAITYWKTAADSALGARLLAPATPRTLLVVGAGELAPWLVRAHRAVRPSLGRVLVWNRGAAKAEAMVSALRGEGVAAEVAADLDTAVPVADVITACTRSQAPLIKGALLRPGVHLDLVGGFTPEMREADDDAARRSRIYVDSRESVFAGVGDILQPIANGAIAKTDVRGDLYDLVGGGCAGRQSDGDITFYKNAGGGHLDLMTAATIFEQVS
jgi:ornithine cyclodeaminase